MTVVEVEQKQFKSLVVLVKLLSIKIDAIFPTSTNFSAIT
jgi:hypothetical protein